MLKIKVLYQISILALLVASCSLSRRGLESGTLRDYTNLAGCSFIIELENGDKLEPLNLKDFEKDPVDGKHIAVKYEVESNLASNCNVGKVVKIVKYDLR